MKSDKQIAGIARVCHEVNKTFCEANGDYSQMSWEDSPGWQKDSAISGVIFRIDNPESSPEDSHVNWLKDKKAAGWIWGTSKNTARKFHPCMLPYDKLPKDQQTKDHLFVAVVDSMRESLKHEEVVVMTDAERKRRGEAEDQIFRSSSTQDTIDKFR